MWESQRRSNRLPSSIGAAIAIRQSLGAYKQQDFVSHSSGGWEPEIRMLAWPKLQVADYLLYTHMVEGLGVPLGSLL